MIPKKIYYCWFGNKELPKDVKKYIKSWENFCPDYQIIRIDESNFDINKSEFTKKTYELKKWAFVSDYARLKVIYDNGGIYLDTDVELLKSLDEFLNYDFFIGRQQNGNYPNTGLGFGAVCHNSTVKEMLEEYENISFEKNKIELIACPFLNSKILEKKGFKNKNQNEIINNEIVFTAKYFDPFGSGRNTRNLLCNDSYSIHHYSASWTNNRQKIKRKIVNLIGLQRIQKIKDFLRKNKEH